MKRKKMAKIWKKADFELDSYNLSFDHEDKSKKNKTSVVAKTKLESEIIRLNKKGYTVMKSKTLKDGKIKLYAQKFFIEK